MSKIYPFPEVRDHFNSFNPHMAQEIRDYANTAVDYIHGEQIGSIALVDISARPFYIPLIEAWRSRYDTKTDPMPPIFFLNPKGFEPKGYKRSRSLSIGTMVHFAMKGPKIEFPWRKRSMHDLLGSFAEQHPALNARREQPLLILDTCVHSGLSVGAIAASLEVIGFNDIRVGVVYYDDSPEAYKPVIIPDLKLTENEPAHSCQPFGIDRAVQKTYRSAHSVRARRKSRLRSGALLRKALHGVMRGDENQATH